MVPMMVSRTLSIPVWEAASISCTSMDRLSEISLHEGQASGSSVRQGVAVGCFADATGAGKQVRVMQSLMHDGVAQRARDRFLPGHFVESLRAPLARDYLIGHENSDE